MKTVSVGMIGMILVLVAVSHVNADYTFTYLDYTPYTTDIGTLARGINGNGQVVGWATDHTAGQTDTYDGFKWSSGAGFTSLGYSRIFDINGTGDYVGLASNGVGFAQIGTTYYSLGASYQPQSINDNGQVVGVGPSGQGFLWTSSGGLTTWTEYQPYGINNNGDTVGWYQGQPVLRSSGGVYTYLEAGSHPIGINDKGEIVGWHYIPGDVQGFFRSSGGVYTYLEAGREAQDINNAGQIVGWYDGSGFLAPPAATVPIPAAVWLLGSGLIGLIGVRRRFKR